MAEDWVLKGSLKGPQGEPGETPDLSEYLTLDSNNNLSKDGSAVSKATVYNSTGSALLSASASSGSIDAQLIADAPYNSGSFRARGFGTDYNATISATANRSGSASITASSTATSDGGESHSLSIGVSQYGSYIGGADNPIGGIYAADVLNPDTANGNRVPNLNNVRSLIAAEPGLPEGGTEGQVLTKTADGEAWQDAPEADLTGMLKGRTFDGGEVIYKIGDGGEETPVSSIAFASNPDDIANGAVAIIGSTQNVALFSVANGSNALSLHATSQFATLTFNSKSVNSITNAISSTDTDRANELVTGKAVADYVAENAPSVDVSHLLNADVQNATVIDPRSVDITTLSPGTYQVTKGSYVDNGDAMGIGVNGTQFPDAMIQMSDYDFNTVIGILNVYSLSQSSEKRLYELNISNFSSGTGLLRFDGFVASELNTGTVTSNQWSNPASTYVDDYMKSKTADPDELVAYVKNYGGGA